MSPTCSGWATPETPAPIRQYLTFRRSPERVRIIVGEPARLPDLRSSWSGSEAVVEGRGLVEDVARRAWLTLERAERRLRGSRYKVPKFPRETLTGNRQFQAGVAKLARDEGVSYERMAARTSRYVREVAATHSPWMIDLVTGGFRRLITKAYVELDYDPEELKALYQLGQRYPLVFLPTHKSNLDHQSLQYALYENGLPPNHTAGGINMNFFPVGPLIRRSGVFFIRREFKDNEPYKFVLRHYIDYLIEKRFPLEWYIEGGRSRSGKLLPPKLGMLAYVVDAYRRGTADDVVFIPVAIAYDQIQDVRATPPSSGRRRSARRRSAGWSGSIRGLQRRYGSIHLRLRQADLARARFLAELGDRARPTPTTPAALRFPSSPSRSPTASTRSRRSRRSRWSRWRCWATTGPLARLRRSSTAWCARTPPRRLAVTARRPSTTARRPGGRRLRRRRAGAPRHRAPAGRRGRDPLPGWPPSRNSPPPTTATWSSTSSSTGRSPSWRWPGSTRPEPDPTTALLAEARRHP